MGSNSHASAVGESRRLLVVRPVLTNRVSESFKHGSVGGVGRKPGPYPAGNAGWRSQFRFAVHAGWSRVPELWTFGDTTYHL